MAKVFPNTYILHDYLRKVTNNQVKLVLKDDPPNYVGLLKESYIVTENDEPLEIENPPIKYPIKEIITRFVASFIRCSSTLKDQNCLCLGFRSKASFSDAIMRNYMDIENTNINTVHSMVSTPSWQLLADRIGDSAMRYLFERAIFTKTINGSYIQVCGIPANELAFRLNTSNSSCTTKKRKLQPLRSCSASPTTDSSTLKTATKSSSNVSKVISSQSDQIVLGSTKLPRFRMLYNNRRDINPGLPSNHHFITKSPEEIVGEIIPLHKFQQLDTTTVKEVLVHLVTQWKNNYEQCDFHRLFQSCCVASTVLQNHSGNKTKQCRDKPPKVQQSEEKSKKSKRGCRSGKQRREKKLKRKDAQENKGKSMTKTSEEPVDTNLLFPFTLQSNIADEEVSSSCDAALTATTSEPAMPTTVNTIPVGVKLFNQLLHNIQQDNDQYKTQDSQILLNTSFNSSNISGDSKASQLSRNQKARKRKKAKRQRLLNDSGQSEESVLNISNRAPIIDNGIGPAVSTLNKNTNIFPHPADNAVSHKKIVSTSDYEQNKNSQSLIWNIPSTIIPAQTRIEGRAHHYKRKYPTFCDESNVFVSSRASSLSFQEQQTLASDDVHATTTSSSKTSTAVKELWEYATPLDQVITYVTTCFRHIFPLDSMWGSRHNWNKILSRIVTYLRLGRVETYTIAQVMSGLEVSQLPWIQKILLRQTTLQLTSNKLNKKRKRNHDEAVAQSQEEDIEYHMLAEHIVFYLFTNIVHYLLSNCFYITECEQKNNELFYFAKSVWFSKIVKEKLNIFRDDQFKPVLLQDPRKLNPPVIVSDQGGNGTLVRAHHSWHGGGISSSLNSTMPSSNENGGISELKRSRTTQSLATFPSTAIISTMISTTAPIAPIPIISRSSLFRAHIPLVRLVPKKSSLRIITNLKSKFTPTTPNPNNATTASNNAPRYPPKKVFQQHQQQTTQDTTATAAAFTVSNVEVLTNVKLYHCLHVFKHIYDYYTSNVSGFSAFGLDDIYKKLRTYRDHHFGPIPAAAASGTSNTSSLPPPPKQKRFYFATLDIEKCYDNIDTSLLYDVIQSILLGTGTTKHVGKQTTASSSSSSSNYKNNHKPMPQNPLKSTTLQHIYPGYMREESIIHKYYITHTLTSMQRVVSQPIRYVSLTSGDLIPFNQASEEIAKHYSDSVITDTVYYPRITPEEILRLLKLHLFEHMVKLPLAVDCCPGRNRNNGNKNKKSKLRKKQQQQQQLNNKKKKKNEFISKMMMMEEEEEEEEEDSHEALAGKASKSNNNNLTTQYATQTKGIPQGSVLSPILCNFYYGYVENLLFHAYYHHQHHPQQQQQQQHNIPHIPPRSSPITPSDIQEDPYGLYSHDTMIIRLIDDYLIITTNPIALENILMIFFQEYNHFGGNIHPEKIKINIDLTLRITGDKKIILKKNIFTEDDPELTQNEKMKYANNHTLNVFTWCGIKLHTQSLICIPDISRLLTASHYYSISNIYEVAHIGKQLQKMIKSFVRMKYHSILLDQEIMLLMGQRSATATSSSLVGPPMYYGTTIVTNLYQLYLVVALRVIAYLTKLHKLYKMIIIRTDYLFSCIQEGIYFASHLLAVRTERKISRKLQFHDHNEHSSLPGAAAVVGVCTAEDKILRFGKCPVTPSEAIALGWKAYVETFTIYPITFDNHHTLLPWMKYQLQQSQKHMTTTASSSCSFDHLLPPQKAQECEEIILSACQWQLPNKQKNEKVKLQDE